PPATGSPARIAPSGGGVTLAGNFMDHPRLQTLRDLYRNASGLNPFAHFTSIASYGNDALVAGNQFGLLVLRLDAGALDWASLVDVVWIPAGAYSVRVMPGSDIAVVVDGAGRVLLVDLKKIDESSRVGSLPDCRSSDCRAELFPTARNAITAVRTLPAGADWVEVGADDPRIIWKSAPHLVSGTLAPVIDPLTGFVLTGDINTAHVNVVAATDPRLHILVNTGPRGLGEVSGIVPLGVDPPPNVVSGADGSLAAFRVETTLPAGMAQSVPDQHLEIAIESEAIAGAAAAQTFFPLPPAHLRRRDAGGRADPRPSVVTLDRTIPLSIIAAQPTLKYQHGADRYVSPWIVAIADPRASKQYLWPAGADKRAAACYACDRPAFLQNDPTALELYATGRHVAVRPEWGLFGGAYEYLNRSGRFTARVASIPADTIRPPNVLGAAQDPPVARGRLQSTVLLHSGEIVERATDLDAGGRAGWNVVFDRTYRSRTLGATMMGAGWESSILRRLRPLPNRNVEYRDGSGEEWLFRPSGPETYDSPAGLYLRLSKSATGWTLVDQKLRSTTFDTLGRLSSEWDVFYDGHGAGNIIHYLYDPSGRLRNVVDPMNRISTISYDADGHLKTITDWRGRAVDFHFDAQGRLSTVELPRTHNASYFEFDHSSDSDRPKVRYAYMNPSAGDYDAKLELATNLASVQDPDTDGPRVVWSYADSGSQRDMLQSETWGSADRANARFEYTVRSPSFAATQAVVVDVLRQRRTYDIGDLQPSDYTSDRAHVDRMVEQAVPVWAAAPFGSLPDFVFPSATTTSDVDRTTAFGHAADGRLETVTRSASTGSISLTTRTWDPVPPIGFVLRSQSLTPSVSGMAGLAQNYDYEGAFLESVESDGERVDTPEPRRGALAPQQSDGGVTKEASFAPDGLLKEWHTLAPAAPASGEGEKAKSDYFPPDDAQLHQRGMPRSLMAGDDLTTTISYPDADTEVRDEPRGVRTRTEYDELRRPVHIVVTGPGASAPEEWFAYDARGHLVRHRRKEGDKQPEERYEYDAVGRMTRSSLYDGATEVESTQTTYDMPGRITRTILPAGGIVTSVLDGLGRTLERRTEPLHPFATISVETTCYDVDDNVVFAGDGHTATATRFDAAHRAVETLGSDLARTSIRVDGWGRLRESKDLNTGVTFAADYTPAGKLKSTSTNTSSEEYGWDAAGRTTSIVSRRGADQPVAQTE
ncbi:MAG TPA: DUF6531 domain-containing protein, partial [Thermoanaerobaculia bacterium]|nr:DUF6531 domain-containing protein [Thermoanaerobaculia bacterium]